MSDNNQIIRNVSVIEAGSNNNNSPFVIQPVNVVADNPVNVNPTDDGELESVVGSHDQAGEDEGKDDDESDYSYTYDEEEEYSGFLIPTEPVVSVIEEDGPSNANNIVSSSAVISSVSGATNTTVSGRSEQEERKQKWVEPPPEAVSMSLRAERQKTGGRRRLASDLYKIMSSSTKSAGFTLEPMSEDSMDKWCIKLFDFDSDSNLAKDMLVVGLECVELEMSFPEQYPFEPPFVRVVSPRFERQTGFVMNGALCMELLTKDGWNPINDIESVIVSIRSLMVVGDGRVKAAVEMGEGAYAEALKLGLERKKQEKNEDSGKRKRESNDEKEDPEGNTDNKQGKRNPNVGSYSEAEASSAYDHLSKFHQEKGWDKSGWWAERG